MNSKICPNCRNANDATTKFCSFCGQQFAENASPHQTPPQPIAPVLENGKKSNKLLWIAGGLTAVLFLVGFGGIAAYSAYTYFKDTDSSSPAPDPAEPPISSDKLSISAEDMSLLANDAPAESRAKLAADPAERRKAADNVFQSLALAVEAKAAGIAERPEVKRHLDFIWASVLAQDYIKNSTPGNNPSQFAPDSEIKAFFSDPNQDTKFAQMLKDLETIDPSSAAPKPEQIEEFKKQWATTYINARKAVAAGLDQQRRVQLLVLLQRSGFLNQMYVKQNEAAFKATDEEIKTYLSGHPELDTRQARTKAETVLRRVQSGEDFAALAKEFSEDPGSKNYGGLYANVKKGQLVGELETSALALEPGQVGDRVIETDFGFHVIKLEAKKDDSYSLRQILLDSRVPNPDKTGAPLVTLRERAAEAVKNQKTKVISEKYRDRIAVAEDFQVASLPSSANNTNKASVSAKEMFAAYKTDAAAADQKYKGKTVAVEGTVEAAGTDLTGKAFALFAVGDNLNSVRCTFPDSEKAAVTALKPNQAATFNGTVDGITGGDVMISGCTISK